MNSIIALMDDGSITSINNQKGLSKLTSENCHSVWVPIDDSGIVYKKFEPDSLYLRPIKKVEINYTLTLCDAMFNQIDPCVYPDYGFDSISPEACLCSSKKVVHLELENVVDFITFLQSIVNLTIFCYQFSLEALGNGIAQCSSPLVCFGGFIMEYTPIDGEKINFTLKKKHAKMAEDPFRGLDVYNLATLFVGLTTKFRTDFREDPDFKEKIFFSKKLTSWDMKSHNSWLATYRLPMRGVYAIINEKVKALFDRIQKRYTAYRITKCEYNLMVSEDILPEEPMWIENMVDNLNYYDVYDVHKYVTQELDELVEMVIYSIDIIRTSEMLMNLNPVTAKCWEKETIEFELNDMPDDDSPDIKFSVYKSDCIDSNPNDIFAIFVKTILLRIEEDK